MGQILALIRSIFWLAIFVGATFAFTVLFEHGPTNFTENAKKEVVIVKGMLYGKKPTKDAKDKAAPANR